MMNVGGLEIQPPSTNGFQLPNGPNGPTLYHLPNDKIISTEGCFSCKVRGKLHVSKQFRYR